MLSESADRMSTADARDRLAECVLHTPRSARDDLSATWLRYSWSG